MRSAAIDKSPADKPPADRSEEERSPEEAERPFALRHTDARGNVRLAAVDASAWQAVQPGMSVAEALAILPELMILPWEPAEDWRALCELADAATCFSPLLGVEAIGPTPIVGRYLSEPQAILIDMTGLTAFFGSVDEAAAAVADWCADRGLIAAVAMAPNPAAAWAAAHYARRSAVAAALASRRDGGRPAVVPPVVWSEEELDQQLGRLCIAALRIDAATHHRLTQLGVKTIDQLRRLPRSGLAGRFEGTLLQRLDQAAGLIDEPITCYHAGIDYYSEFLFDVPTDRRDTIAEVLRRLCVDLAVRLRSRGQGALRVLCRLRSEGGRMQLLRLGLFRPTAEAAHLQRLLLGQFDHQIQRLDPLAALSLQADLTAALRWQQGDLFAREQLDIRSRTAELIDVLAGRLGGDAVVQARPRRDSRPEAAAAEVPLTGADPLRTLSDAERLVAQYAETYLQPGADQPLRRPLMLLQPPEPLRVLEEAGVGPPKRFRWSGRVATAIDHWGPERIESGWWDGETQRRDYYRVATDDGGWLWIYRDLSTRQWFLHGQFE